MKLLNGIDRIEAALPLLRGRKTALLTHAGAVSVDGRRAVEVLQDAGVELTLLFSPEHGLSGTADAGAAVADDIDSRSGLKCLSLYGSAGQGITPESLEFFEVLAVDLADVGVRWYTYPATLFSALEKCASAGKSALIFDRANPLGNTRLEGPLLDPAFASIVGRYPVPVRHGMTLGSYARFAQRHFGMAAGMTIDVVPPEGIAPEAQFPQWGREWRNPSPNLRSYEALLLYTGTCLFEGTNLSEGRGTDQPFLRVGAPWMDTDAVLSTLPPLPGIRIAPEEFTPSASKFAGECCRGLRIIVENPNECRGFEAGIRILDSIRRRHPDQLEFVNGGHHFDRLLGSNDYRLGKEEAEALLERAARDCREFAAARSEKKSR